MSNVIRKLKVPKLFFVHFFVPAMKTGEFGCAYPALPDSGRRYDRLMSPLRPMLEFVGDGDSGWRQAAELFREADTVNVDRDRIISGCPATLTVEDYEFMGEQTSGMRHAVRYAVIPVDAMRARLYEIINSARNSVSG